MDDINLPDSCSDKQVLSMLQLIDSNLALSETKKAWLKEKLMDKYGLLVMKNAIRTGISVKEIGVNKRTRED